VEKRHEQRSWWADFLGCHPKQLQYYGADSISFELGCDQTHGLIANRSDRDQQGDIDPVLDHQRHRFRQMVAKQASWSRDRAHKRKVSVV